MLRSLCCLLLGHSKGVPHAAAGMELDTPKGSGRRCLLEDGEAVLRGLRAAPRPCRLQGPLLTCGECLVDAALPCGHQVPGTVGALPSPSGGRDPSPALQGPWLPSLPTRLSPWRFPQGEAAREQCWGLSRPLSSLLPLLLLAGRQSSERLSCVEVMFPVTSPRSRTGASSHFLRVLAARL